MLLGSVRANRWPEQNPAPAVRLANEAERRQHQLDELTECLRRVQRCQQAAQGVETR